MENIKAKNPGETVVVPRPWVTSILRSSLARSPLGSSFSFVGDEDIRCLPVPVRYLSLEMRLICRSIDLGIRIASGVLSTVSTSQAVLGNQQGSESMICRKRSHLPAISDEAGDCTGFDQGGECSAGQTISPILREGGVGRFGDVSPSRCGVTRCYLIHALLQVGSGRLLPVEA